MPKVNLKVNVDGNAEKKTKSLTGSFIKMSLAIEGVKIVTKALIDISKKAIESFKVQEQAEKKLEAQTGGNIKANKEYASSIQDVTTVGDEAILNAQQLGIQMGISKDEINEASKQAVGLSESLGIDLNNAMKLLANAQAGNTSALQRYIPELKTVTDQTEALALIQDKANKGFDIAIAKADTFTGGMEQLKNAQGDTLEVVGSLVSLVGKDFVDSMIDGQKALQNFLSSEDVISNIAGTFAILKDVLFDLAGVLKSSIMPIFDSIGDGLSNLNEEGQASTTTFSLLSLAMKSINIVLSVISKVLVGAIDNFFNFANVIKQTAQVFDTSLKVFQKKATFEELKKQFDDVGEASKKFTLDFKDNVSDLVSSTIDQYKGLNTDVKAEADKYAAIWDKSNNDIKNGFNNTTNDIASIQTTGNGAMEKKTKETTQKQTATWKDYSSVLQGLLSSAMSTIQMGFDSFYDNQQNSLQASLDTQLGTIEADTQKRIEMSGVAEESRTEALNREIEELQNKINTTRSLHEQDSLQEQLIDKENEKKRIAIIEDGNSRKEKAEKKAAAKERELKIKQYNENKGLAIANIWINAASAVMGFWAAFAPMGIPGLVLAAVASATTLTMAGVQSGIVGSQTPGFQDGGVVGGNSLSGDRVKIGVNSKERVLTPDQNRGFEEIAFGGGAGGGTIIIENMVVMANDVETFRESTVEQARIEGGR